MIMEWFRWDSVTTTETIWSVVARSAKTTINNVILTWISVLEYSALHSTNGSIAGFSEIGNDIKWGFDDGTTSAIITELKAEKLILEDKIANWKNEQTQFRAEYKAANKAAHRAPKNDETAETVGDSGGQNVRIQDNTKQDNTELKDISPLPPYSDAEIAEAEMQEGKPGKQRSTGDDSFDRFWEAYPKKKDRADALKAWKGISQEKREAFIRAAKNYAIAQEWQEERYVKYPASFLRRVDPLREYVKPETPKLKNGYNLDGSFGEPRELTPEEEARYEELAEIARAYEKLEKA